MGRTTKPAAAAAQSRKTTLRSLERGGGCCSRNYTGRMTRCRLDDGIARYLVTRASRRRERHRAWYRYGAGYHRGATSETRGVAFREGEATMTNGSDGDVGSSQASPIQSSDCSGSDFSPTSRIASNRRDASVLTARLSKLRRLQMPEKTKCGRPTPQSCSSTHRTMC
jgi:hypothetical protein